MAKIVITGASSGIGEALSHLYSSKDNTLLLIGRNQERLSRVHSSCAKSSRAVYSEVVDVYDYQKLRLAIEKFTNNEGLDIVFANAGISISGKHEDYESIISTLNTNLIGAINTIHIAIDNMKNLGNSNGIICVISSMIAKVGAVHNAPAYSTSKVAISEYCNSIRKTIKNKYGIHLSVAHPWFVESRMTAQNKFPMPMKMKARDAAIEIKKSINEKNFAFPRRISLLVNIIPSSLIKYILSFFSLK